MTDNDIVCIRVFAQRCLHQNIEVVRSDKGRMEILLCTLMLNESKATDKSTSKARMRRSNKLINFFHNCHICNYL